MQTNIFTVIKSHLNDAQIEMQSNPTLAAWRMAFVRELVDRLDRSVQHDITDQELDQITVKLHNRFK